MRELENGLLVVENDPVWIRLLATSINGDKMIDTPAEFLEDPMLAVERLRSGEFQGVVTADFDGDWLRVAGVAKELGARIVLLTSDPEEVSVVRKTDMMVFDKAKIIEDRAAEDVVAIMKHLIGGDTLDNLTRLVQLSSYADYGELMEMLGPCRDCDRAARFVMLSYCFQASIGKGRAARMVAKDLRDNCPGPPTDQGEVTHFEELNDSPTTYFRADEEDNRCNYIDPDKSA